MFTAHPPPPRASAFEWTQAALLAGNLTWTTLCLGGYRAETMVVTGLLIALVLALHFGGRAFCAAPCRWHPAGWLFVPFLAYALANVLWVAPARWLGWQDWLGWAQMIAVFWVAVNDLRSPATRRFLFGTMLTLAVVAVALACYQRFARPDWLMLGQTQREQFLMRSSGPFAVPNSLAAMLVLLLPATALALGRGRTGAVERVWFGYLTVLLALGLGLTFSRGAWLGLAVALAAWPWFYAGVKWRRRLGWSAAVAVALAAVGATVYFSVPPARERLDSLMRDAGEKSRPVMWRAAWAIFRGHPVVGAGAGSYNVLFEQHRPEHEQKEPQWAHNDYLNTLSDYGAVGFVLFFGAGGVLVWRCARGRRGTVAGASDGSGSPEFSAALGVGLLAFALHLFVDFHLKIPALAMLAALVAALIVGREWPVAVVNHREEISARERGWPRRLAAGAAAVAVLTAGIFWIVPHYRAEAERGKFRGRLDELAHMSLPPAERVAVANRAREAFSRALALDPSNAQAWADRAYAAAIIAHDEPQREKELGVAAEADARRALEHAPAVPEFWLRLGVALDMQRRWLEAGEAFSEGLRLAPVNASAWFYHAYHLSLNPTTVLLARAAVAISLRLDPSRPEAEALRQNLAAPR